MTNEQIYKIAAAVPLPLITGGIGALTGGLFGKKKQDQSFSMGGALMGAAAGTGLGFAAKPFMPKALAWAEKNYQAQRFIPLTETEKGVAGAQGIRTMGGMGSTAKPGFKVEKSLTDKPSSYGHGFISSLNPKHIAAEGLHNLGKFMENPGQYLKNEFTHSQHFVKNDVAYKRSIPGRLFMGAMTGPGIAATTALMPSEDQSMGSRVGNALGQGALWGISPRLGQASMIGQIGYQMLKRKPKPTLNQDETNIIQ